MNDLYLLNDTFHFHRLFGQTETFADALDSKSFVKNINDTENPLMLNILFGGSITYSIPTTFECINSPYYLLLYVEKGDILIKADDSYQFGASEMILISPEQNFRFDTKSTPCYFHMFLLSGAAMALYVTKVSHASFEGKHISNQLIYLERLLQQYGKDVQYLINKSLTDILTDCMLTQASVKTVASISRVPKHIAEMKSIIDKEYASVLTLDQLEQRLVISKYRLCRDFSTYYGQSPLQYLNNVRIKEAKTLLEQTDITIHAIGFGVGIPNTSHFIKLFKRETNLTPAEYRKKKSS